MKEEIPSYGVTSGVFEMLALFWNRFRSHSRPHTGEFLYPAKNRWASWKNCLLWEFHPSSPATLQIVEFFFVKWKMRILYHGGATSQWSGVEYFSDFIQWHSCTFLQLFAFHSAQHYSHMKMSGDKHQCAKSMVRWTTIMRAYVNVSHIIKNEAVYEFNRFE